MTDAETPAAAPANPILAFLAEKGRELSPLVILTHDHPDPDSMASAFALAHLAEKLHKIRTRIVYRGLIGRTENQVMASSLRLPIRPIRENEFKKAEAIALVDTQPPFRNNPFPLNRRAALVIDHHPRHARTQGELVVIDEAAGATATLLTEALRDSGLELTPRLATALAYGIGAETQNLGREAGPRDVAAYLWLIQKSNTKALSRIQHPPRPRSFFQILGRSIRNAFVYKEVIGVHLGEVPNPDPVSQTADFLLTHERMRWSICTGRFGSKLHVSLRSRDPKARAGRLLRGLLQGGGGGHQMIAGGAVEMDVEAGEELWRFKEEELTLSFLKALGYKEPFELQFPFQTT